MTQRIPKLPRQQPQGIFQGRDGYRLPSLHDYAAMVRIILNCSCSPPQGKAAVFFKTGFDLPAAVCYHQNAISGYDGIGRHARFRFSCRETCRFDPCYPHHVGAKSALLRRIFYSCGIKKRHPPAPLLLLSKSNPLRWASIWFPPGANTVPFPPRGENGTMLAPSSLPILPCGKRVRIICYIP